MTDTTISCPKCGANIPLTEAVTHRLREQLEAAFKKQRAELNAALAEREEQLNSEKRSLEDRAKKLEAEVANQLKAERQKLKADALREAQQSLGEEMTALRSDLEKQAARLKEAQTAELSLRKEKRALEEAKSNLELEVARKLDAERKKIADTARQQATDAERLKLTEKEKIIADLQREIQNLKQKAEQGSMQLQGETLELTLESDLRAAFRYDEISEVKKGQRGADVLQRVRTNVGLDCGTILWEAKHAKNWSPQWADKLKDDQREAGSDLAVIVTTCPPTGLRGIGQAGGVWVCEPPFVPALAAALRHNLIGVANQRLQDTDRSTKMARLYDHLCGNSFRQQIQAIVEGFILLQEQLNLEKRALTKQWKEREKQLSAVLQHTAELYGGIQGIAGREALPEIAPLQLPAPGNED